MKVLWRIKRAPATNEKLDVPTAARENRAILVTFRQRPAVAFASLAMADRLKAGDGDVTHTISDQYALLSKRDRWSARNQGATVLLFVTRGQPVFAGLMDNQQAMKLRANRARAFERLESIVDLSLT